MLSYETKSKLANFFQTVYEGERQLEIFRQILCEHREFEPYAAYCRIDRLRRGFLTATDIKLFLADNSIQHTETACAAYIRRYSGREGEFVSYQEFLKSVLSMEDAKLRTTATQRRNYDVGYDEFLPQDVEYTLSKIIDLEITFYKGIDYEKYSLAKRYDYSHAEAFVAIDRHNSGRIDYDNLKAFFRNLAQFPTNEEIIAIIRRIDKDDDGVIKYSEFVEALEPLESDYSNGQGFKGVPNRVTTSILYGVSPQRKIASADKVQSPEKQLSTEKYAESYQSKYSPMEKAAIPGRTIAYSPARNYTPNPKQFTKTATTSEEIYTNKQSKSISEEKDGRTSSTAEKTSAVKNSALSKVDKDLSSAKQVKKVLNYDSNDPALDADTLIYTLKQFIVLDKELESAKQELALRTDFNLLDFFRVFDIDGKGAISFTEFENGFKKFGLFPNKDDFYLVAMKYDRDNDGKIRFSEFVNAFTPMQNDYAILINDRIPCNPDLKLEISQLFAIETRKSISQVLRIHLDIEAAAEGLRQKLNKKFGFTAKRAFDVLDLNADGQITIDELREVLDAHKTFATEKELNLLIERLDLNRDGKISYSEFLQEISPKCEKIFI